MWSSGWSSGRENENVDLNGRNNDMAPQNSLAGINHQDKLNNDALGGIQVIVVSQRRIMKILDFGDFCQNSQGSTLGIFSNNSEF